MGSEGRAMGVDPTLVRVMPTLWTYHVVDLPRGPLLDPLAAW